LLCKRLDLFSGELVAIDGSKFKFTKDKLKELFGQIEERIEAYLKELDRSDEQDDGGTPGGAHAIRARMCN
jgi:hypothetical protein